MILFSNIMFLVVPYYAYQDMSKIYPRFLEAT